MIIKIGDKNYPIEGYLIDIQKIATDAYQQGKEEADQFLKQWKDDVMNSLCKYDANSVEEVYQSGINRGITSVLDILEHLDMQMLELVKDKLYKQDYEDSKNE